MQKDNLVKNGRIKGIDYYKQMRCMYDSEDNNLQWYTRRE